MIRFVSTMTRDASEGLTRGDFVDFLHVGSDTHLLCELRRLGEESAP